MQKARQDETYCINSDCKNKCSLHAQNYEFDIRETYCFMQYCLDYMEGRR